MSECAFGPHAALAKKPEMLMYNMYIPLSELSAALPADQIHHSDTAPEKILNSRGGNPPIRKGPPPQGGGIATAFRFGGYISGPRPPQGGGSPVQMAKKPEMLMYNSTFRFQNFPPVCVHTRTGRPPCLR